MPRRISWVLDFLCEKISGKVKVVPARVKSPFWWRVTRGARNSNLQIVITHASHVCSKLSFSSPLRMNGMQRMQFDHTAFWPSIPRNLITHVLTIFHVKFMQSAMLEWKRFDLPSLSPALCNLWLLLVMFYSFWYSGTKESFVTLFSTCRLREDIIIICQIPGMLIYIHVYTIHPLNRLCLVTEIFCSFHCHEIKTTIGDHNLI